MRFLTALLLVLLVACGGAQSDSPAKTIDEQVQVFHMSLRWGRFDEAALFVEAADREAFIGEFEELGEDYQITDFEIRQVVLGVDARSAQVVVRVQSMKLPNTVVQEHTWEEEWLYNDTRGVWEMANREVKKVRK